MNAMEQRFCRYAGCSTWDHLTGDPQIRVQRAPQLRWTQCSGQTPPPDWKCGV